MYPKMKVIHFLIAGLAGLIFLMALPQSAFAQCNPNRPCPPWAGQNTQQSPGIVQQAGQYVEGAIESGFKGVEEFNYYRRDMVNKVWGEYGPPLNSVIDRIADPLYVPRTLVQQGISAAVGVDRVISPAKCWSEEREIWVSC